MAQTKPRFPLLDIPTSTDRRDVPFARAAALYNGLIRRELYDLFPPDLSPSAVHAHLATQRDAELTQRSAGQAQHSARSAQASASRDAEEALPRLLALVNGTFPPGSSERSVFFPPGAARQSDRAQLRAIAAGMAKHPLPKLPPDLSLARIETLVKVLDAEASRLDESTQSAQAARTTQENLRVRTAEIRDRLTDVVIGYFGRYSPEVAQFGLTVRSKKRKPKSAKKPPPAAPTT